MAQMIKKSTLSSPTLFTIGLLLVLFWILVAIFAENLVPYHPNWPLDWLGRDIFSNLLLAAQNMMMITLIVGTFAFAIGLIFGMVAGYYGKLADKLLRFISWVLLTLPPIILLILMDYHWRDSEFYIIIASILVVALYIFKNVRALVTDIKKRDFILVAIMRGEKSSYIIWREILPNIIKPLLADFLVRCSQIVSVLALVGAFGLLGELSFANWGAMVLAGQEYIDVFVSCIAIISLVLGLNLMALSIECDEE